MACCPLLLLAQSIYLRLLLTLLGIGHSLGCFGSRFCSCLCFLLGLLLPLPFGLPMLLDKGSNLSTPFCQVLYSQTVDVAAVNNSALAQEANFMAELMVISGCISIPSNIHVFGEMPEKLG